MSQPAENYKDQVRAYYHALNGQFLHLASKDKPNDQGGTTKSVVPQDRRKWAVAQELAFTPERFCSACGVTSQTQEVKLLSHCGRLMIANLTESVRKEFDEREQKIQKILAAKEAAMFKELDDSSEDEPEDDDKPSEKEEPKKEARRATYIVDNDSTYQSHWVIKEGGEPQLKITAANAFMDHAEENMSRFASEGYKNEIMRLVEAKGYAGVANEVFGGRATLFTTGQQNPAAQDFLSKEPMTGEDDGDVSGSPHGEQAGPAMINPEVGDKLLEDQKDPRQVIDMLTEILVPIVSVGGDQMTPDDIVNQIGQLSDDEEALAEFRGRLKEKVQDFQANQELEKVSSEPKPEANAVGGPVPPATQQPQQSPPMGAMPPKMGKLRDELRDKAAQLEQVGQELRKAEASYSDSLESKKKLESENRELLEQNKFLLQLREFDLQYPRAQRLAYKESVIGIVPSDQLEKEARRLVAMSDDEFFAKEDEVELIYQAFKEKTVAVKTESKMMSSTALSVIPLSMSDKEEGMATRGSQSTKIDPDLFTGAPTGA